MHELGRAAAKHEKAQHNTWTRQWLVVGKMMGSKYSFGEGIPTTRCEAISQMHVQRLLRFDPRILESADDLEFLFVDSTPSLTILTLRSHEETGRRASVQVIEKRRVFVMRIHA